MAQDALLLERGFAEHGMQRQHQRRGEPVNEIADHRALGSAEDAVFVLKPDRINPACVDPQRSLGIGLRAFLRDDPGYIVVDQRCGWVIERVDIDADGAVIAAELLDQIAGKGRNAALTRGERADQRDPPRRPACGTVTRRSEDRENFGSAGRIAEQKLAEVFAVHRARVLTGSECVQISNARSCFRFRRSAPILHGSPHISA